MRNDENTHNNEVRTSFGKQVAKFATYHMSKSEYTDYLIRTIRPAGSERMLEVAAGTCVCGRALAPHVATVECLDLTEEMLAEGKRLGKEAGIQNITFVVGDAQNLPYEDGTFDLVITRLSLHHFEKPEIPFSEMRRVLKTGGKLVIWDMESGENREQHDGIETMRDPSHTRILSRAEFEQLFQDGFVIETEETTLVPVSLQSWMDLTDTPDDIQGKIRTLMLEDMEGNERTGFDPYMKDREIYFDHHWLLLIGRKI